MTVLKEMQFEILPYENADEGVPFGIGLDISVNEDGFQPQGAEWYTEDSENPINGSRSFGHDHLLADTWQWQLHVNRDRTSTALQSLGTLATAWRMRDVRDTAGAVTSMRYHVGGRTRRVFGRPRPFSYTPSNGILNGFVPVDAAFACVDAYTYDDDESTVKMELQIGSLGGLILPAILPIETLPPGNHDAFGLVGGDADTYPVVRFEGPITRPSLQTDAWEVSLDITLDSGEYVEVDARPWQSSVLFAGDTSVAAALGPRQWLSKMSLSPGPQQFFFRGNAATPGATCEVRWRSAWNSI